MTVVMTILHQSYILYLNMRIVLHITTVVVAAQRTYMERNGVSECAKFKALGLLKNDEEGDEGE